MRHGGAILNRRSLLKALPAAVVAGAAPAAALCIVDPAETPMMRLFREWEAQYHWIDTEGAALNEAEIIPYFRQNDAQGDRVMATRCENLADFAAKLIVATLNGNHDLSDNSDGTILMAEARALVA